MLSRWLISPLAVALISLCPLSAQADPSNIISVSGTNLLLDGQPIYLQGLAIGDIVLDREGRPLSDYGTMRTNWSARAVRISIHPYTWKHYGKDIVIGALQSNITASLDAGLIPIIDWHTIGWPDGAYEIPPKSWGMPPDLYDSSLSLATNFWTEVSTHCHSDGRIMYEIWNEPWTPEDDNSNPPPPLWNDLKPTWQQLLDIIRKNSGTSNVVIVTGNQYAYNMRGVSTNLMSDPNVAYCWHNYAGQDNNRISRWLEALDGLDRVKPVLVTEWGFEANTHEHFRGTPANFGNKFTQKIILQHHLHSTAWCWHPYNGPEMLKKDWKTPTAYGRFVRKFLRTVNGPM